MRIVPAGVHHTIGLGLVVDLVLLENREGVHVGPNEYIAPRAIGGPAHKTGHARLVNTSADILHTKRLKPLPHKLGGLELLKPKLGILMQMPAIGDNARQDLVDIVPDM
jgi:hypothetical protein